MPSDWVTNEDVNPVTGEVENKHFWLFEHGGLVFGSGWCHDGTGRQSEEGPKGEQGYFLLSQASLAGIGCGSGGPVGGFRDLQPFRGKERPLCFCPANTAPANGWATRSRPNPRQPLLQMNPGPSSV